MLIMLIEGIDWAAKGWFVWLVRCRILSITQNRLLPFQDITFLEKKPISLSFRDEHLGYNQEKTFCINALGIYK